MAADAHAVHTVGALDLGGSSLEVTFVPAPGAPIVDIRDSRARARDEIIAHNLLPTLKPSYLQIQV